MGCSTAEGALVGINLIYGIQKERLCGVNPACALDCIGLAVNIFRLSAKTGWIRLLGVKFDGTETQVSSEHDFQDYVERISRSSLYATFKVTIEKICFERGSAGVPDNGLRVMFDGEPRIMRSSLIPSMSPRYKTLLAARAALKNGETSQAVRTPKDPVSMGSDVNLLWGADDWILAHIVILCGEVDQFVFDLCRQDMPSSEALVPEEHMSALKEYIQGPALPDPSTTQSDPDGAPPAEAEEGGTAAAGEADASATEPDPSDGVPDGPRGLLVALVRKADQTLRAMVPTTEEAIPLPSDFRPEAKRMLTAFFGAFAYFHNKEQETLKKMRSELKFLSLFQHYIALIREYKMVPEYALAPLQSIVDIIEEHEKGDDQPTRRKASVLAGGDFFRAATERTMRAQKLTAALRDDNKDDKKWPAA